jgi:ATP-binding cassette, subfamily B, bacterial
MTKMLGDTLHCEAKARGKPLTWDKKPKKERINIEIPEYEPKSIYEYIESRALSGGQWQRVALARSFMKIKEADLLILDEPSSALDPQAEYEVFKSLMELRKNRTTIFIVNEIPAEFADMKSHRFHTVRAATKIMVMDLQFLLTTVVV